MIIRKSSSENLKMGIMNILICWTFVFACLSIPSIVGADSNSVVNFYGQSSPNNNDENRNELRTLLIGENETFPICSNLRIGQYKCDDPVQDPETLEFSDCGVDRLLFVNCSALDGVNCTGNRIFTQTRSCYYTYD